MYDLLISLFFCFPHKNVSPVREPVVGFPISTFSRLHQLLAWSVPSIKTLAECIRESEAQFMEIFLDAIHIQCGPTYFVRNTVWLGNRGTWSQKPGVEFYLCHGVGELAQSVIDQNNEKKAKSMGRKLHTLCNNVTVLSVLGQHKMAELLSR